MHGAHLNQHELARVNTRLFPHAFLRQGGTFAQAAHEVWVYCKRDYTVAGVNLKAKLVELL